MAKDQRKKNNTGAFVLKVKSTEKNIKVLLTKAKLQSKGTLGIITPSLTFQRPVQIRPTPLTCEGLKGT